MNNKKISIGLALSGGSALGAAHIGVIKALSENNIPISCVSGTSAGSIVASFLAFGVSLERMIEISKTIDWSTISEFRYSKMGLESNEPISEITIATIGDVNIEDAKIPLAIVATDIDTGKEVILRKGNVAKAIMASTCLPGIFIPIQNKGKKLVDGGLVENLPLSPLKSMGAEINIGVNLRHDNKKTRNILDVISNAYNTLSKAQTILLDDQADLIIRPNVKKFDSFDFEKHDILIEEGYKATILMMPKIKERIFAPSSESKSFIQKIFDFWKFKK
ncbi:MAG TPA: patatin-like phospholipase family protein [Candidatus Moranbacteria bacterium]|nr:patatin-like phospholipase family protein [Candidatus Moranbacteria bacterium]